MSDVGASTPDASAWPAPQQQTCHAPLTPSWTGRSSRHRGAVASAVKRLDAESAVLRVIIRWSIHHGQIDQARKAIGELGRLLKAQHDLSDQEAGKVTSALDRVLDAVGAELGVGL